MISRRAVPGSTLVRVRGVAGEAFKQDDGASEGVAVGVVELAEAVVQPLLAGVDLVADVIRTEVGNRQDHLTAAAAVRAAGYEPQRFEWGNEPGHRRTRDPLELSKVARCHGAVHVQGRQGRELAEGGVGVRWLVQDPQGVREINLLAP